MTARLAGIDVGSSKIAAQIRSLDGALLASASAPTPICARKGGAEHDPDALFDAVASCFLAAAARAGGAESVRAIAFASIGEAGVFLDREGAPLAPIMAWWDPRPAPAFERIARRVGLDAIARITGLAGDPTFSLAKIGHALAEPGFRPTRFLNIANWLGFRLTGAMATDPSLASRTMAYDLARGGWRADLLEAAGAPPDLLPPIRPAHAVLGRAGAEDARAMGLAPDCVVAVGAYDHEAGALAAGCGADDLLDDFGTAEALRRALDGATPDPGALAAIGLQRSAGGLDPDALHLFGGTPTAAAALAWFENLVGEDASLRSQALDHAAPSALFLPHLRLGAPPFPDAPARGAFLGLAIDQDRRALYRAVMEGLALDAAAIAALMTEKAGLAPPRRVILIGGAARNDALAATKAAAFGLPLLRPTERDGAPFEAAAAGAALLAGMALGVFDRAEAGRAALKLARRAVVPDERDTARFARLLAVYREARAALRPLQAALIAEQGR